MDDLNNEQKKIISQILKEAGENTMLALDPANKQHKAVIDLFMDMSNKNKDRYPGTHAALEKAAQTSAPVSTARDDITIVDQGKCKIDGKRATARIWHGAKGGATIAGGATLLLDADTKDALAFGTGTQVGGTFLEVPTNPLTAKAATGKMTAVGFTHVIHQGEPPRFNLIARTRLAASAGPTITINDPVLQNSHTTAYIVIGVGRDKDHINTDADYFYTQDITNTPKLLVPFTGNAVLPYTIDTSPPFVLVTTKLFVGGSNAVDLPSGEVPITGITASGTTLTWSFPFNHGSLTSSLSYGPMSKADADTPDNNVYFSAPGTQSHFFFEFTVNTTDPVTPQYTFSICSTGTAIPCSCTCNPVVKPIQFWWHCLAAGTMVTLQDGGKAVIEKVDNSMRVLTGASGGHLGVVATTLGSHGDESPEDPVFGARQLITQGGRELILSPQHPVMTPSGPVKAFDLQPGDSIMTVDGTDSVQSCEPYAYTGTFHNLKLGNDEDYARGHSGAASFVANGICVGDHGAEEAHRQATRHNLAYMLPRLPKELHADFKSALADVSSAT